MTARCSKPTLYVTQAVAYQTADWLKRQDGKVRQVERCRECEGYHVSKGGKSNERGTKSTSSH